MRADPDCVCCKNHGALPHLPGHPELVTGDVVEQMCTPCIVAAFMGGGRHPHVFEPMGAANARAIADDASPGF